MMPNLSPLPYSTEESRTPDAELRLPAESAYVSVLRTVTAGLAARVSFTLDDIEDLRIAVDEACALLLQDKADDARIDCRFWLGEATMSVSLSAQSRDPRVPEPDTFAWRVLTALTTTARAVVDEDRLTFILSRSAGRHP